MEFLITCSNSSTRPLRNDSDSLSLDTSAESFWFSCWNLLEDAIQIEEKNIIMLVKHIFMKGNTEIRLWNSF